MITLNLKSGANRIAHQAILTDCLRGRVPFRNSTGSMRGEVTSRPVSNGWLSLPPYPSLPVYVVYSYDTPIAWVEHTGQWVQTAQRFSPTTGGHQSAVRMALSEVLA